MQLISKTDAQQLATAYQNTIAQRVFGFLLARAQSGLVGGDFQYSAQDSVSVLNAVRTQLQNAGWTVTVDAVNLIATIS